LAYLAKRKKLKKRKGENEIEKAKETAFRFLSYRPRSVEEIRRKLKEKNFPPLTIKRTLARIEELGYLNDRNFAYDLACSSIENKQWGIIRIRDTLAHKGISQEIITHTTAKIEEIYDFTQVARRALEAKFTHFRLHQPADEKIRKRAVNYLRRKGFSWNIILSVIKSTDK
jgi:regulatory protein